MIKLFKQLKFSFLVFSALLLMPVLARAEGGLVPCGTSTNPDPCTFNDFFIILNTIMSFLTFAIALPLATILIVYGGIVLVVGASNPSKRDNAKKVIYGAVIGLVIVLASFVIVKFIVVTLSNGESDLNIESVFNAAAEE